MTVSTPLKFVMIGSVGASIEIVTYALLIQLGLFYFLSNAVGYHLAIISTFFLHGFYTFSVSKMSQNSLFARFCKYILLMYAQLAVGTLLLIVFVEYLMLGELISKIIQMLVVIPASYFSQKMIIFK